MSSDFNKIEYKKQFYPVNDSLIEYLKNFNRYSDFPISYNDLLSYQDIVRVKENGLNTLWSRVTYRPSDMERIITSLLELYQMINGHNLKLDHLYIGSIDFCSYGNSKPFRVKIINEINDNYDYLYIKSSDSSRIYGLELEEIFSPNKINFLSDKSTIVEEHIIGVPGDQFIEQYSHNNKVDSVRLAKEFVKFNERCFVRLLGDMRAYNYVVVVTEDFDTVQYRIRAIDFDQQSFEARKNVYLPQYFKDNNYFVMLAQKNISQDSAEQYMNEERGLLRKRLLNHIDRFNQLYDVMTCDSISTKENIESLKKDLFNYYDDENFLNSKNMADILKLNIRNRLNINI